MKRVLQVNKEIAGWLVIFFTLLSMAEGAKAQAPFDLKEYHTQKVLGTITASPHSTDQNKIILTVSVPKQFVITSIDGLRSLSSQSSGDHVIYSTIMDITEYNNLPNGKPFNAQVSLSDIEEPKDLETIFNFYTPQSTRLLSNNVVEVSKTVDPMNNNAILKFTNPNKAITICLINDNDQIKFPINVEGGNLTIKRNQFSHTSFNLSTLKSGSLTLNNCTGSDLEMTGGTLTFDGSSSTSGPFITNLTAKGGIINYKNSGASKYITNMTIEGNVNINGENQFDGDDLGKGGDYIHLADKITINSGTVKMNKVGLHKNRDVIINNGDVTMEKCAITHTSFNSQPVSPTPCIQQKGGTVLLKDCFFHVSNASNRQETEYCIEVTDGTLTVDKGQYDFGTKSFIHAGANAIVNVRNGFLGNPHNFAAIYQEGGTVEIAGGEFPGAICIESGDLTITGGEFVLTNTSWNDYNAHIHILGNNANVSLQGGHYGGTAVYAAPGLSIQPESLLASGYGLYTWDQQWQPDVSLSADHLISGQENKHIKSLSAPSTPNNLLEAAKTASVGTEGTDVKVIVTGEGYPNWQPCELEINTAKGLAWFASGFHNLVDNGGKYRSGAEVVRLTANIDMSEYDWIPTSFSGKFDGQGHCISGLKVNQSDAAFLSSVDRDATLANLVIRGTFNSIRTDYTSSRQQAAGLCLRNDGLIVNCGVQQSTVSCVTTDRTNVQVGGLVASNYGTIRNCYMTGNVTCEASHEDRSYPINYAYHHYIGGLVGDNWSGGAYNCYHADGAVDHTGANLIAALRIHKDDLVQKNEYSSEVIKENCTTTPSVDALNQQVQIFNAALEGGAIAWSTWVTENGVNGGHPIHVYEKDNPSIIETQIALLVEGDGELEATYSIKNDDPNKDPIEKTIKANTTVNIRNLVEFKIIAKPGKGAVLDNVTSQRGSQAAVKLDGIKENEEFKYDVSSLSTTITAYFRTETLYVNKDTPFIGGTKGEIEEVEHIEILKMGTSDEPVEKELGNVKVTAKEGEGTTTIGGQSYVILNLSGTSSLGKLINEGTAVFRKETAATLEVKEVMNKGTLIDETGLITEVINDETKTILSLNGSQGDQVEVGEEAILRAKATVKADEPVRFQWQLWNGTEWKDVEGGSTIYPEVQTRSGSLRASDTDTYEDEYKTGVLTEDRTLQYRCLIITPFRDVPEETAVSTTLTTYAKVEVTPKSDPGTDPDPIPTPSYTYYEVTLPEVTGATTNPAAGKYTVKEGDSFSFTLTLDADYDQSKPEVKAGSEVLTADANGTYTIANVSGDLTITITGITLNNPTANAEVGQTIKVWGEGTTLHIYTEKRETIRLYTFNGQLLRQMDNAGRISITNLPQGNYLIRIGSRTWKIAL